MLLSNAINVVKKKPLVLMIFPVLFLIEWLLSPFVINMSNDYIQREYHKCRMGYYNINLLGTIFFTLVHIFTLVIVCLVLIFFYRFFFLDKKDTSINNNSKTRFLKVIVEVLATYICSFILWFPFFISYFIIFGDGEGYYTNSKYTIFLSSFFYMWMPALFTCFLISHAVFYVQRGNDFKNTLKKSFKVILTKNSFIVLALCGIMALIYANIRSYQNLNSINYINDIYDINARRIMLIVSFLGILIKSFSVGFVFMLSSIIVSKSSKNNIKNSINTDMHLPL